jgi:hypothetical protein
MNLLSRTLYIFYTESLSKYTGWRMNKFTAHGYLRVVEDSREVDPAVEADLPQPKSHIKSHVPKVYI